MSVLDIALHESAHAVVAIALGARVKRVSLRDDGSGLTEIEGMSPRVALRAALAGQAASVVFKREADIRTSEGDYIRAFRHAVAIAVDEDRGLGSESFCAAATNAAADTSPDEVTEALAARWVRRAHELVGEGESEVRELLGRHRLTVRTLAGHLEQWRFLDGRAVHAIVEGRQQAEAYEGWRKVE